MTKQKIFFQSSLSRTGSTLLQNLIGQNPDFYVSPTSGLSHLVKLTFKNFVNIDDFFKQENNKISNQPFYKFFQGGINSYYNFLTSKPYILDKGFSWIHDYSLIKNIFESPKIIVLVRDLRDILASHEKMYLKDPSQKYRWNSEYDYSYLPIEQRYKNYINMTPLGQELIALYNTIHSNYYNELHIIKYENLVLNPENEIKKIYNYLNVPYFKHNFNHIEQITKENDNFHVFGDHIIRSKLEAPLENYKNIIPKHISNGIYDEYNWYFQFFNYPK